ncbi:MAG: DUF3108 domain-containing protein [Proteobacteria bacterium]|nr:DUF3108 domain-containing protein [Pseudomonadota bacterium]
MKSLGAHRSLSMATAIALSTAGIAATAVYAGDASKANRTNIAAIPPAGEGSLGVAYTIAFWGIPFGHSDVNIKLAKDSYKTSSVFQTSGIVSLFWKSDIQASSTGTIASDNLEPAVYDSYDQRRADKKQRVKVTFTDADPTVFADPPYSLTKYPVSSQQKKEALDPMSAVALVMTGIKADAKNPCGTVAPVFDGRRRYNIEFKYLKDEPANVPGVYKGKAHLCEMHYNQIAGFKPKVVQEGKSLPPVYGWFVDVPSSAAPTGKYLVLIKAWASNGWGTADATITKMDVDKSGKQG